MQANQQNAACPHAACPHGEVLLAYVTPERRFRGVTSTLLDEMEREGVERCTITYNAAIAACARAGQWEPALRLFTEMGRRGVPRDALTHSVTIAAFRRSGRVGAAAGGEASAAGLRHRPRR